MRNLFYRLSSSRSFAKLLSKPMHARLEERRRVMFAKSSVFAVVALAAFVSVGALLFPEVAQARAFGVAIWAATRITTWGEFSRGQFHHLLF